MYVCICNSPINIFVLLFFTHYVMDYRHETPVLSKPIELIHLSEDLVVLDKPCSLPVSHLRTSNKNYPPAPSNQQPANNNKSYFKM